MRFGLVGALATVLLGCATASGSSDAGDDAGEVDAAPSADAPLAVADAAPDPDPDAAEPARRIVIVMIGDGMGKAQLEATSHYLHGAPGQLAMYGLPHRGELRTGGPSGITDSAAAATVMATGVYTYNGVIALDRDGQPLQTLVELAQARGLPAGVVTTSALPHATPAAFTAHDQSRHNYVAIADDQVREVEAEVMLGGGARYFRPAGPDSARTDDGLLDELAAADYQLVTTAAELGQADAPSGRLFGAFAAEHLTYTRERPPTSPEPTLRDMSLRAIEVLDRNPDGFFLMIEGARIDMAGHANDLANTIGETAAFDEAVAAVAAWAADRDDVTLIVTADHECGGLEVLAGNGAGALPTVTWRWGNHTNARVDVFASGPGTDVFHDELRDHRWVHAVARARLVGDALAEPAREAIPDGHLTDLRHQVTSQTNPSGFGIGFNQLDRLYLDADSRGLSIGIEGLFQWDENAVVILIDVDYGAGTGHPALHGALSDTTGLADALLANSSLAAPGLTGFGADLAIISAGGADPQLGELLATAGLRGLRAPFGQPGNLGWFGAAINFGEGVRTRSAAAPPRPGEGLETFIPWSRLYPTLAGAVPPNATIAIAAILVNDDGGYTSNQALPAFPAGTTNPGRTITPLPGLVLFQVDTNGDGTADGNTPPTIATP